MNLSVDVVVECLPEEVVDALDVLLEVGVCLPPLQLRLLQLPQRRCPQLVQLQTLALVQRLSHLIPLRWVYPA